MDTQILLKVVIIFIIGMGIFFSLPSTSYFFMFLGIFHKHKSFRIERDNLKNSQYAPFADRLKSDILAARAIPCETVKLKAHDGVMLYGRYYNKDSDKTIIFIHGYQSNSFNNFSTVMMDFLDKGYNVLLVDQRAHGNSGGKFTTLGCKEKQDLLLWIDHAAKNDAVNDIIVYGISMGSATVGHASSSIKTKKVKGLIMEAGFTCFYDEFQYCTRNTPFRKQTLNCIYLMSKSLLKVDIKESTEDALKNNSIPVLFLHGDCDKEVQIEFTERNFNACASAKEFITIEGAGHTLCYLVGGKPIHDKIDEFIDNCIH